MTITQEQFDCLLTWLSKDRDVGGRKYETIRSGLVRIFVSKGFSDAEDLADETINRVILKSSEEKIENKLAYCYGVARNVYRESLRKEKTHVDIDDVTIAAKAPEEPAFSSECLDQCLEKLPPESRTLLLDYFSEAKMAKIQLHKRIS